MRLEGQAERQIRVAVLGLGNLMRTDDGAGMHALNRLAADARLRPEARLIEGGTLGLELLYHVETAERLLVLDAVDAGEAPGTLMRFRNEALDKLPHGRSVHLLGLSDLVCALRLMDRCPREIVLLGVQPQETGWGTQMTPLVEEAIPRLVEAAVTVIDGWLKAIPAESPSCTDGCSAERCQTRACG